MKIAGAPSEGDFFNIVQDNSLMERWLIDHPSITENDDDTWYALKLGKRLEISKPLPIEISTVGQPMDISRTAFGNLVLSARAAKLLQALAPGEVEYLDTTIDNSHVGYKLINILNHVKCLHPTLTVFGTPNRAGYRVLVQPELEKECWCRRHSVHRAVAF